MSKGEVREIVQEIKTSKGDFNLTFEPVKKGKSVKFVPKDAKLLKEEKEHDSKRPN